MNYTELVADIQSYMLRNDAIFVAKIPALIEQGMNRIFYNAKNIGFQTQINFNIAANTNTVPKPNRWKEQISIYIEDADQNKIFLEQRSKEFCDMYQPNPNTRGIPKYYYDRALLLGGDGNGMLVVSPTPNVVTAGIMNCLLLPEFNDGASRTNFLSNQFPNLLLYSCLLEASLFLDNEEKRNKYEMMFGQELETINNLNSSSASDRMTDRNKS